jgi:hypothetical protein
MGYILGDVFQKLIWSPWAVATFEAGECKNITFYAFVIVLHFLSKPEAHS